ncbi:MAG: DNA-binding protein [Candidatus Lokiarchaeota archaeon]|nr:DNA-binding protein [Candidatus Lokiarchaeota archaeon]
MEEEKKFEGYPKSAPGTHVRSSDIRDKKITYTWWEPEVQYSWSLGPAMSKFLEGLKEGKILGIHCKRCKRVIVPPRMFCEYCYGPTEEWTELKDTGTIETYSISYLDPNARRIEEPILIGVISIDGASPQHGFMHYFGEMSKDEIKIGMKVKAVWKSQEEREGSITDIKYFKPLKGGGM